jgi:hypothetical protein
MFYGVCLFNAAFQIKNVITIRNHRGQFAYDLCFGEAGYGDRVASDANQWRDHILSEILACDCDHSWGSFVVD